METKQEEAPAMVSSINEVISCPSVGYLFIPTERCAGCESHHGITDLGVGPASGRQMHQIACLYPMERPVMRCLTEAGLLAIVHCPKFKALRSISECKECELHKGTSHKEGKEQMLCSLSVLRNTAYIIKGVQEG